MRVLTVAEVLELHGRVIAQSGGGAGLRDRGGLESSVNQPLQSFGGQELYPSIDEKAAALGYFLISNHPFVDGNKRIGHAAMEVMLVLNGREISATVDEQERIVLSVAAGRMTREEFTLWGVGHVTPRH
ncbi:MAG TPA: type II toxin-antitoxin system death-on-curing family toxin [Thermoanaerobaculia bacterium]